MAGAPRAAGRRRSAHPPGDVDADRPAHRREPDCRPAADPAEAGPARRSRDPAATAVGPDPALGPDPTLGARAADRTRVRAGVSPPDRVRRSDGAAGAGSAGRPERPADGADRAVVAQRPGRARPRPARVGQRWTRRRGSLGRIARLRLLRLGHSVTVPQLGPSSGDPAISASTRCSSPGSPRPAALDPARRAVHPARPGAPDPVRSSLAHLPRIRATDRRCVHEMRARPAGSGRPRGSVGARRPTAHRR